MSFFNRLFGRSAERQAPLLSEDQKVRIEKLIGDLGKENNIEGRISAAENLGAEKQFGDVDIPAALSAAGKKAAMQFESKRMGIAIMHGVQPNRIKVQPHVDDSRVTSTVVKILRKISTRKDTAGIQANRALTDLKASLKSAEIRTMVGL